MMRYFNTEGSPLIVICRNTMYNKLWIIEIAKLFHDRNRENGGDRKVQSIDKRKITEISKPLIPETEGCAYSAIGYRRLRKRPL